MYFENQAVDPSRAKQFYETIFEWKFRKQPHFPIDYYQIATGGINGGLLGLPASLAKGPNGTNTVTISMEVASFREVAGRIILAKGTKALPKFAIPGTCWQGYFQDTEGTIFGILEVDQPVK